MSYFKPDNKKILKLIRELTIEKPYIDQNEVCQKIPKKWKLAGCGTGNIQNSLINLLRMGLITPSSGNIDTENTPFYLTEKGENELKPWHQKRKNWIFIFLMITALATLGTFLFSIFR